jgi:type IV pilus assembly protein PilB
MSQTSLLKYLQQNNLIDSEGVRKVLLERTKSNKTEEVIIKELNLVDEDVLAKAKSAIFNIPFIDLSTITVPEGVLSEVPIDNLSRYRAVPFERGQGYVKIAMEDPFDIQATQALQSKYPQDTRVQVYISTPASISLILDRRVGDMMGAQVADALEDANIPVTTLDAGPDDSLEALSGDIGSAPVARIVNSILQYAVKSKSSDVHIEVLENRVRVRFRINGVMTERLTLPRTLSAAIVSRIKIMSNLKIDEKRIPQDNRFQIQVNGSKIDVRVSIMPMIYGEKVVLRLLESDTENISLEDTGLRGHAYKVFVDALSVTNGIVLVTGPTGSGKTRTLACSLMKVNDPKVNIISLENPVEIRVPGVTQVQINDDVGLTFANALRAVLRQDPDIVMVGEIRDGETAQLAVQASLTGHLVLSTLHTNSAAAAIPRLVDMGIEPYLLASTIRTVAAQRLPRRICKKCIEAYPITPEVLRNINEVMGSVNGFDLIAYINKLVVSKNSTANAEGAEPTVLKAPEVGPDGVPVVYLYKGKGCDFCGGTGYAGRTGIFEVLDITEKISRMIMEDVTDTDIRNAAIEQGMITMIQDGYLKALEGITTLEEVLRVSKE